MQKLPRDPREDDLVKEDPKRALDMLVQLTDWLSSNCNAAYLPTPNPDFDPDGPLPYGPYVPIEQLKASLEAMEGASRSVAQRRGQAARVNADIRHKETI